MNSEEKAYIAGIIDGEGTVTLARRHRNKMPSPEVSIANNHLELLRWIKSKIGAGTIIKRTKQKSHHSDSYVLTLTDNKALEVLKIIRHFLIVKKEHADLLLKRYKATTPRNGRYTAQRMQEKLELVEQI